MRPDAGFYINLRCNVFYKAKMGRLKGEKSKGPAGNIPRGVVRGSEEVIRNVVLLHKA